MKIGDVFVCTELSAKIVSYEENTSGRSDVNQLAKCMEQGNIGFLFQTRNAPYPRGAYTLPQSTSSLANKVSGVVTNSPGNASDDCAALQNLLQKDPMRGKSGLVLPFIVVTINNIPEHVM